jgi:hypothetical protein
MLDRPSLDFERERERKMLVLVRVRSSSDSSNKWLGSGRVGGVGYAVLVTVAASPK